MEREKPAFDILGRIEQERLSRGWSEYALAENSGLTQSTISAPVPENSPIQSRLFLFLSQVLWSCRTFRISCLK